MSIQFSVSIRNARIASIETTAGDSCSLEIREGAQPANCATTDAGAVLATINLPADWLAASSDGAAGLLGTWQDASADGTGTAGHFRLYTDQTTKDNTTCFMQGAVSSDGDMTLDNYSVSAGQQVTITSFTLTDGNA